MTEKNGAIGVVIPTILGRPHLIKLAVESILNSRLAGRKLELRIAAESQFVESLVKMGFGDMVFEIPSATIVPLSEKLNLAFLSLPDEVQYLSWLGDDDLLGADSLKNACDILERNQTVSMVYGRCIYITESGREIFENKSGKWALRIMHFGPNLIPQPGSVWKRGAFESTGGLSDKYKLAIDFDLYFKLKRMGELRYSPNIVSYFRWHPSSQSVSDRWVSVLESSRIRRTYMPKALKPLSFFWEPLVVLSTFLAGKLVSLKVRS